MKANNHPDQCVSQRLAEMEEALERISDGCLVFDSALLCTYVNGGAALLFGTEPKKMMGQPLSVALPNDSDHNRQKFYTEAVGSQKPCFFEEYSAIQECWLSHRAYPSPTGISVFIHKISKYEHTRGALEKSELTTRTVLENLPLGVLLAEADTGEFILANQSICAMLGYDKSELLGLSPADIHPADEMPRVIETFTKMTQGVTKSAGDFQVLRKNGSTFTAEILPLRINIDGKALLFGLFNDISEKKAAEKELQLLKTFVEQSPVSIVISDEFGNIQYVNPHFSSVTGYTYEEVFGKNPRILKSGYQSKEFYEQMWHELSSGRIWRGELANRRKDGEIFWESAIISPVRNAQGKIANYVGVKQDVTHIREALQKLEKSEKQFKDLFVSSPVSIIIHDKDTGAILDANPSAWTSLGFTDFETLQQKQFWAEEPYSFNDGLAKMRLTLNQGPQTFQWKKRNADGEEKWDIVDLRLLEIEGVQRLIATSVDITRQVKVTDDLLHAKYDLNERLKEMQCLVNISRLTDNPTISIDDFLQGVVDSLPSAFQFADIAHACICFNSRKYLSNGCQKTEFTLRQVLESNYGKAGTIDVYYEEDRGFLQEEVELLKTIQSHVEVFFERHGAQKSLAENEERLRLALSASRQGLYDLDLITGQAVVSAEYATMLGYDASEFSETNAAWIERLHPDDRQMVFHVFEQYIDGRIPEYRVEFRQRTKSGEWKWILSHGKIHAWNKAGQPSRMLGTHTDISEIKLAHEALRESEEKYRIVADNTYNWEFWEGPDGNYIYHSPSCEKITGYKPEELQKFTGIIDLLIHPDDRHLYSHHHHAVRNDKQSGMLFFRIITKSGKVRDIEHVCQPVFDQNSTFLGTRGTNLDITEKKQYINAIETQNRVLKEIAWTQSHQVRAPLARIMGLIMLIEGEDYPGSSLQELLGLTIKSAHELDEIIREVTEKTYLVTSLDESIK